MIDDLIKYRNFSKKNIVAAALMLIALVAMYGWFVTPHSNYLHAAQRYEAAAKKIEKTNKMVTAELKLKQKKIDELTAQFEAKKQEFFRLDDAKDFLGGIQTAAEKSGCLVDTLKFSPAKQISAADSDSVDIKQYQVKLDVGGQYESIVKLIDLLQNREQKIWIDDINLHLQDMQTGRLVCNVTLSIYTLKIKEN